MDTVQNQSQQLTPQPIEQHISSIQPKSNNRIYIVLGILALLTLFIIVFYYAFEQKNTSTKTKQMLTSTPTYRVQPTQTPVDEFAGWKTYIDNVNGFEFKYPSNWIFIDSLVAQQSGHLVSVQYWGQTQREGTGLYDGAAFYIENPINFSDKSLDSWVQTTYDETVNGDPYQISQDEINDTKYTKVYGCGAGCSTTYITVSKNKIYQLIVTTEGPDKLSYENTLHKILSSFKFTDQQNSNPPQNQQAAVARTSAASQVKYSLPSNWSAKVTDRALQLSRSEGGGITITSYDYDEKTGRRAFFCTPFKFEYGDCYVTGEHIPKQLGNINGYEANVDASGSGPTYFGAKGNIFYLITTMCPSNIEDTCSAERPQILDSLIF